MIDYSKDYYRILLIDRNASDKEIKDAYYFLVKKFHPDNNIQESEHNKHFAEERFKEIEEAYNILSNPSSKSDYDANFGYNNSSSNKNHEYSNENSYYEYESSTRKRAREAAYSWNTYSGNDYNKMDKYYNSSSVNERSTSSGNPLFLCICVGFIVLIMAIVASKSCNKSSNNQVKYTNTNIKQGWLNENDGLHLYLNNERVKDKWEKFNGAWVHLNNIGNLDTNKWIGDYYVNSDGIMLTNSWVNYNNILYYVDTTGKYVKNSFIEYQGNKFYVDSTGAMKRDSWIENNGNWYHVGYDGKLQKNIYIFYNTDKYFLDSNGVASKINTNIIDNNVKNFDINETSSQKNSSYSNYKKNIENENNYIKPPNKKNRNKNNNAGGYNNAVNNNNMDMYSEEEEEYDISKYKFTIKDDYPKYVLRYDESNGKSYDNMSLPSICSESGYEVVDFNWKSNELENQMSKLYDFNKESHIYQVEFLSSNITKQKKDGVVITINGVLYYTDGTEKPIEVYCKCNGNWSNEQVSYSVK